MIPEEKKESNIDTSHNVAVGTSFPLDVFAGTNEYLQTLKCARGVRMYDQMQNDTDVSMVLQVTSTPIIGSDWIIRSQSDDQKDRDIANFFYDYFWEKAPDKFSKILQDILLMLIYGFVYFEKVWVEKWIGGKQYLICELQFRHPLTIDEIDIKKRIVKQYSDGKYFEMSFDNLAMFVYKQQGDDYWGRSLIRPCYQPFEDKKLNTGKWRIAGTKQATGFIHVEHPANLKKEDAEYKAVETALTKIATSKNPYLITPPNFKVTAHQPAITADFFAKTDETWSIKIRNTGLANFMGLGTTSTGSYSVGEIQLNMFMEAEEAVCRYIEQKFNEVLREMVIVNFGQQDKYPELKCPTLNKTLALKQLEAIKEYFRMGAVKVTKKDEDEIRTRTGFQMRDDEDEIIPINSNIPAEQPIATTNIKNVKLTNAFSPTKRKGDIDSLSKEMQMTMTSNLGIIADKAIADIRAYLKKNGTAGLFDNITFGKNNYQSVLFKKISFLVSKGWDDAKAYASKEGFYNAKTTLEDGDINKVPKVLKSYVANKAKNLAQQQVTELEAIVWNTANKPDVGIDIDELIAEIGNKVDLYIKSQKIQTQADMAVVQTLNDSEQTFYKSEEVEIAYFVYVATIDNATTEYCKWLNGRTFTPYGQAYKLIYPPRHFGCRSYLVPVFGKVSIPDMSRHDTLPPPSLMAIQQF
jgi:SPP1 gp7 family putative phage head morphogenesis protein